jgi:hypothetical protein
MFFVTHLKNDLISSSYYKSDIILAVNYAVATWVEACLDVVLEEFNNFELIEVIFKGKDLEFEDFFTVKVKLC